MIFPYSVDVPMERLPITNWVLIAATLIVSLIMFRYDPGNALEQLFNDMNPEVVAELERIEKLPEKEAERAMIQFVAKRISIPGSLNPQAFQPLQLVTYTFLHGDIWHLLGNMLFLFCFGNAINAKLGHAWFLGLYILFGILSGLAWLLLGSGVPLVGASGAIMGMLGMFLIYYPENEVDVFYWLFYVVGTFSVPAVMVIFAYLSLDLLGVLISLQAAGGVAYISHLVGAFSGIVAGVFLLKAGVTGIVHGERNLLQVMGYQESWEDRPIKQRRRKRFKPPEDDVA